MGTFSLRAKLFVVLTSLTSFAAAAAAQTTGQIEGRVVDPDGVALPGVTVEVTSPALQGTRVAVAEAGGDFRFVFLPPGDYAVRCSLSGFQPVEQAGIELPLGRTVTLRVKLQPAFEEVLTVVGTPPAIDVRSGESGANLDRQLFLALPIDRDFVSVVQAAPGTSSDGSGTVVYGATGLENAYVIDGINTADVALNNQGRRLNFEFIEEVQVKTGGYAAEFGRVTGGVVNVITRSGGNEFHGDVFGYYFSDALQVGPEEEVESYRRDYGGSYTVDAFRKSDLGLDLGGYLVKDRLWFFAAYDQVRIDEDRRVAKDFTAYGGPGEGAIYVSEEVDHLWSGKLTWRLAPDHSLIVSAFSDPGRVDGPIRELNGTESTFLGTIEIGGHTAMLRYEGVLGSDLVVDAQLSRYRWSGESSGASADEPLFVDFTTPQFAATGVQFRSGGWGGTGGDTDTRDSARLNATYFLADLAGGHELKGGVELERTDFVLESAYSGGQIVRAFCAPGHLTESGCPAEWVYYQHALHLSGMPPGGVFDPAFADYVAEAAVQHPESENPAAYFQDSWQPRPSLTLNLGLRWEQQRVFDSRGTKRLDLKDEWAPRLGFAWQVGGARTAKVFGSWGRFYETSPLGLARLFASNPLATTYNRSPLDVACDPAIAGQPGYPQCQAWTTSATDADPSGVDAGYQDEAILGGELAVGPELVLGAKLIHRRLERVIEDANGPDGYYLGNPGRGRLATAPDLVTGSWLFPVAQPERTFTGVELTAHKRFADDWQVMASYLWSRLEGNYDGLYYPDADQWAPNTSAVYDFAENQVHNEGYLSNDRRHRAKVAGTYTFPFGLTAGASAAYRSGAPVSAIGNLANYTLIYLSRRGAWARTAAEYEVDLHLGYPIRVGPAEVNLLLDVFNLLDRQGETARDQRYNLGWTLDVLDYATGEELPPIVPGTPCAAAGPPEYAQACNPGFNTSNAWQDPRSIRLGVRVTF